MMNTSIFRGVPAVAIGLCLALLALQSCSKDDEPIPTTATISGVVTIDNAELWETWSDSGEVQLTFFPEFSLDPPAGWGEYPDNTFGPGVPGGVSAVGAPVNSQNPLVFEYEAGRTEYGFEITLTDMTGPVTFSALAVGFRHDFITDPSLRSATLGVHWNNESEVSHGIVIRTAIGADPIFDFPAPVNFTVEPGDAQVINFRADFSFVEDWY
jgi:hypothetical protein